MTSDPERVGDAGAMVTSVVIVDDSEAYVTAATALLTSEGVAVVGSARSTAEAVELCARLEPEVVLLDINLGSESGFDAARRLARPGGPAIVMVSTRDLDEVADLVEDSPAAGFVSKSDLSASAIRAVIASAG